MAQPGHADDCPACRYEELPAADRAALDTSLFTDHTRRPPPVEPLVTNKGMGLILAGALVGVIGVGIMRGNFPAPLIGIPLALIGLAAFAAGVVARVRDGTELNAARTRWRQHFEAWKAEQTQIWLQHRSRAELWPCPTCASLSCSNQHSSTTTYRTGRGRYDSYTDPR